METFIKIAQFILSLSILVTLHEFGHYITARMFKTRVERFYLFFDFMFPFPTVLNFALFKKKIGDTEYGLGWFPLGGYVKIAGMIDESMDEEFLKSEPQPWEFRSKPAWQRLIIMLGGIIVNILLAIVIYWQLLYFNGESYLPVENAKYGFAIDSVGKTMGLQDGDKMVSYDGGKVFKNSQTIGIDLLLNNAKTLQIERKGQKMSLPVPIDVYKHIMASKGLDFVSPAIPAMIDSVYPKSPIDIAGGKHGDQIIQVDSVPIAYFQQFKQQVQNFKKDSTYLLVLRGPDTVKLNIVIPDSAILGFRAYSFDKFLTIVEKKYGFFESFPAGAKRTWTGLVNYIKQFRIIFNPDLKGYKQVGSFLTIGQQFSPKWDWERFWGLTAFLSIALAFVNLLPIPALDGGHALFTIYEMIVGRAPSDKFLERAQVVGMIIIFALMFFAIGNDILRTFFSGH
ncbi:MAG: metalloprotease RseP [Bacteroidota bacterium]|nr:metalloprotease RseP [Bacteroidota bacterium]